MGEVLSPARAGRSGGGKFRQQFRHAAFVRFRADKTDIRVMLRLPERVLAASETDLEPNILDGIGCEITARIATGLERQGKPGQQRLEHELLMLGELRSLAAAEELPAPALGQHFARQR
jgi:hypothetical protein